MSKPSNSPAKILLADDSSTMHRAVKLGLRNENLDLIYCDNGTDALRLIQSERPDVVLADLDMPGLTGVELAQKIKNDDSLKSTKIILLCGSFDEVDEAHLKQVPADGRLWKPFESHVLVTVLKKMLGARPNTVEVAEATMIQQTDELPVETVSPKIQQAQERTAQIPSAEDNDDLSFNEPSELTTETFRQMENQDYEGAEPTEFGESSEESFKEEFSDEELGASAKTLPGFQFSELEDGTVLKEVNTKSAEVNLWESDEVLPGSSPVETPAMAWSKEDTQGDFEVISESSVISQDDFHFERTGENSPKATFIENTQELPPPDHPPDQFTGPSENLDRMEESSLPTSPPGEARSKSFPTSSLEHSDLNAAPGNSMAHDQLRNVVRQEIQNSLKQWFQEELQKELKKVIDEIDRE